METKYQTEAERIIAECPKVSYNANGIDYELYTLEDGWIAIYEVDSFCRRIPLIQACDINKAKSFCYMQERASVQLQELC